MKKYYGKNCKKNIWLDMDGTICDLYSDPNWLKRLENEDITLYTEAKPLVNINQFSKLIKQLQNKGYKVGIISYLPWESSNKYKQLVKKAKEEYINTVFAKIKFDKIHILPHTIPKDTFADIGDCLIDDDISNRKQWSKGKCYTHEDIINKLKRIYKI